MIWVSFAVNPDGYRARLVQAARRRRVRLYVSEYILAELAETLVGDLGRTKRFAFLARLVSLPERLLGTFPAIPTMTRLS
jgi:predicted nucleic acid-binding protein